jgi:hypothetical protein
VKIAGNGTSTLLVMVDVPFSAIMPAHPQVRRRWTCGQVALLLNAGFTTKAAAMTPNTASAALAGRLKSRMTRAWWSA